MSTITEPVASAASFSELKRLSGNIGAELSGIKLSGDLPAQTLARIYQSLLEHKVIFFRGQHHLDDAGQEAFAKRFGSLVPHPTQPTIGGSSILELDASNGGGRADSWHTDVTFVADYPKLSILRSVVIPEYGGDTVWANTATAYTNLPEALKDLVENLWAIHTNEYDYAANRATVTQEQLRHYKEVFLSKKYETEHPVVHVHPETGERNLLLGHFIKKFVGLSSIESARIFAILQERTIRLDNTVRWSWRVGDVAIWDNRATQHYAVNDYGSQPRIVRRVTVAGERPFALDGRRSIEH